MNSAHRDDVFRIIDQGRKDTRELSKRITGTERSRICREAGNKLLDESHQKNRKYERDENNKKIQQLYFLPNS